MAEAIAADIGIFGGTGLYSLLSGDVHEEWIETPYGPPSDQVTIGEIAGKRVAFLPRHSKQHTIPPHRINYRANVWVFKSLGITDIIAPNACGSLQTHVKPGEFVICDQFVDRTTGRLDSFYDGPLVTHVSSAEPYCPLLREHAIAVCRETEVAFHDRGTVVVCQGPRFSTKAESRWFTAQGWEVINMTQYPECILARELEMSYVNISLITDYDAGLVDDTPDAPPVTNQQVVVMFRANLEKLRRVIVRMIETLPNTADSPARNCLAVSRFV